MRSPFGLFSKRKHARKDTHESEQNSISSSVGSSEKKHGDNDEVVRAATRIQARMRGKQARSTVMGVLYKPVGMLVDGIVGGATSLLHAAEDATVGVTRGLFVQLNSVQATDAEVEAPTPDDRWFTPTVGWTVDDGDGHTPHYLMPTAREAAPLFPSDEDIIGELRVEVLEAENLPNMDSLAGVSMGDKTDAYAMLIFENYVAQTSVIFDSLNPRWAANDPKSFRAFRFPVLTPYSVLYVCVEDFDGNKKNALRDKGSPTDKGRKTNKVNADDPIGRVAIQLGRLTASTQYDCWFELGHGAIEKPNGKLGSVRLRFSVTFKSERARMVRYLKQPAIPIIPFNKKIYRKHALFAKYGKLALQAYDWDILMVYVDELKIVLKLAIGTLATLENILLWRTSYIPVSSATCVGFQFLLSHPHLVPSAACIVALAFLHSTYAGHACQLPCAMHTSQTRGASAVLSHVLLSTSLVAWSQVQNTTRRPPS